MVLQSAFGVQAERIKRRPPTDAELGRLASENVMNDGILRKGDVISTDRGFFVFLREKPDGSYDFAPVPNPLFAVKQSSGRSR
jgi:hypothetical protein